MKWNEKMTVRCADGIITTNTSIRDRLEPLYGLRGKPCEVVYNGPNANFETKDNPELVEQYKGKRVLLYVGEMAVLDCIESIIEAADVLVNTHQRKDCIFVLLGDGPERARLERLAVEKGLQHYTVFTGKVPHARVMEYLHVAEICLAPDQPNGLNEYLTLVKTLEYMKACRPFVAFDLKETRLIAADSALFSRDLPEYVQHILRLLDHPEEAQAMGRKGNRRIEAGFLWDHQVPQLLKLYKQVLCSGE
jgi:glycosyltransferase involved in cell wall biosynthesis